jgi:hypothetical protein
LKALAKMIKASEKERSAAEDRRSRGDAADGERE